MKLNRTLLSSLGFGLAAGVSLAALQGCDDGPLGNLAEQCGLTCNGNAFIEGKANISGIASVDAFFGATLDLNAAMKGLSAGLRAELDAIAVSVGLEPGAGGAEIAGALEAKFAADLQGGINIEFAPPKCEASVEVAVSAAAECDVEVDPGSVEVSCSGSCKAEAGVAVDCGAEAELKCTGTAPNLECEGGCTGTCAADFSGGGACEGTCKGECDGECSLTNAQGDCEGSCSGSCTGTCDIELKAEASCDGQCQGQCTFTPPSGMCDASASAKCEAMAGASVECSGGCEGSVEPPSVSAECEASVKAKADASIECKPPELKITYEFSANLQGDLQAQAEFKAWLEGFKGHFAAILALRAKGEIIVDAAINLSASAEGAVTGAIEELAASADLKASIGGACALGQIAAAVSAIVSASGELSGEVSASVEVIGSVG